MIGALEWRADGSGFDLWVIVIFVLVIKHTYPTQCIPLFRRICENQEKKLSENAAKDQQIVG